MEFVQNLPFFGIVLALFSGVLCSILKRKFARVVCLGLVTAELVASLLVLLFVLRTGESYVYMMGHFPAPWGNEIRVGILEAFTAVFFCVIMLLSILGGLKHIEEDLEESKENLFYTMVCLLLSSLLALIYTNDLFTAYVFVEINTISACGLIVIRQTGRSLVGGVKYMIMSLLGSGLFLIGLCMIYDITGHLLMSNIKESITELAATGAYAEPLTTIIALVSVGLAIKSALFPFHSWLPDTYGFSTPASSAIMSSLVSKGYIFLLIKIIYRVIGFDVIVSNRITNVLFVFGLAGMIIGSLNALKERDIRRMVAYSSVAQIGYIYMGIGLGTVYGMAAALFHIYSHASGKSLLFIAQSGLTDANGGKKSLLDMKGVGFRNKIAGLGFAVGSLSMVGIPLFAGFISKYNFATASMYSPHKMLATLLVLALSTVLNAMYFLRTVIRIYTPTGEAVKPAESKTGPSFAAAVAVMALINIAIGTCSGPMMEMIERGLHMFS